MATVSAAGREALGETDPAGSVHVFLDESYEPYVAAAAVVVESTELLRLDGDIRAAYDKMSTWYRLDGLASFDEFRRDGFHATSDPYEVQVSFVALLAEVLSFKSLIVYSDGSTRPDLSEKKRLMVVFDNLVRDVLRAYANRPRIVLHFESAQDMDRYVEKVVLRAVKLQGRRSPDVAVRFGSKRDPDLLAIPDYVLHIFNKWRSDQPQANTVLDPRNHLSRSFKAVLGSVSMARSLEDASVIRRDLQ